MQQKCVTHIIDGFLMICQNAPTEFEDLVNKMAQEECELPWSHVTVDVTEIGGIWILGKIGWRYQNEFFTLSLNRRTVRIAYQVDGNFYTAQASMGSHQVDVVNVQEVSKKKRGTFLQSAAEPKRTAISRGSRPARRGGRAPQPIAY